MALGAAGPARAQSLRDEPYVVGDGRLTLGVDLSVTASCASTDVTGAPSCTDDPGFFNYTDYDHSVVRMIRIGVTAALRASRHFSLLGELRSENAGGPLPYALYLRYRPWIDRNLDVQVGRVPPTFGAFARRVYASDNILIGYPLAYQYLTSLRPDSLPASADELLRMRGRGWLSNFSVGETHPRHGMPVASVFRWDTGVQVHAAAGIVEGAASLTVGTLANPLVRDDNDGKQYAGRLAVHPTTGLTVGVSAARGPFVTREAAEAADPGNNDDNDGDSGGAYTQIAWGADAEYSWSYYLIRFETIVSDWTLPNVSAPAIGGPLRTVGTSIEGRYKIRPRLHVAARFDHLGFSTITGSSRTDEWDAPVDRLEVGGGYLLQRNLQLKMSFQHNTRDGGRATMVRVGALQLVFWF